MATKFLSSSKTGTLYFGYGSNLSQFQMTGRCPASGTPIAIARLNSWMWIITERGYANIIPISPAPTIHDTEANSVWGILYNLTPDDESTLDKYEGWHEVLRGPANAIIEQRSWKPFEQGDAEYNKMYLPVKIEKWLVPDPEKSLGLDEGEHASSILRCLIYISEQHLVPGRIKQSYVRRMGRAARECIALGVSEKWVNNMFSQHGVSKDDPESFHDDILAGVASYEPPRATWEAVRGKYLENEAKEHSPNNETESNINGEKA